MKKSVLSILIMFLSLTAQAEYIGGQTPSLMYGGGKISFAIDNPPSNLCSNWGRHLTFDATTPEGKNILTILLAAMMANKKVSIWYTPGTAPGTTHENGCNESTMGKLSLIGINS